MQLTTTPSATGAVVVSTWVIRWGVSSSQLSVRWTLYPTQEVLRFSYNVLPDRTAT